MKKLAHTYRTVTSTTCQIPGTVNLVPKGKRIYQTAMKPEFTRSVRQLLRGQTVEGAEVLLFLDDLEYLGEEVV